MSSAPEARPGSADEVARILSEVIEDLSILAEAFSHLPQDDGFAISYKVAETEEGLVPVHPRQPAPRSQ